MYRFILVAGSSSAELFQLLCYHSFGWFDSLFLHVLPTHQLLFIPMFTTFYFFPPARMITQFGCRMNFMSMNFNSYEFHTSWCMSWHSSCTGRINYCCWMCCIYYALVQVHAVKPAFWNILFYRNKYDDYSKIKIFFAIVTTDSKSLLFYLASVKKKTNVYFNTGD